MNRKSKPKAIDLSRPYFCEWCHKSFARETTLVSHRCEPKERAHAREQPHVRLGYHCYQRFYSLSAPKGSEVGNRTYQEFCNSNHYKAFTEFGCWLLEQQVQEIDEYLKYLLTEKLKFHQWRDVHTYQRFLAELLQNEPAEKGLARSLATAQRWSEEQGETLQNFWKKVNSNVATNWIRQGKISPWMLYNCNSAVSFLERCNIEQLGIIQTVAPANKWKIRLLRHKKDADLIKTVLSEAGM